MLAQAELGSASTSQLPSAGGSPSRSKAMQFSDKDEHIYFWFPLLAGLSELTFDPRTELRQSALGVRCLQLRCTEIACLLLSLSGICLLTRKAMNAIWRVPAHACQHASISATFILKACSASLHLAQALTAFLVQVLFDTLKFHGGAFTTPFWTRIFDSVLLPIFDHVRAEVGLLN